VKDNWDPKPNERKYYRSAIDGQRGYLVRRGGEDCVRLDRPMEELVSPLDGSWAVDSKLHVMSRHAAAKIAYIADQALCRATGEYGSKKEWIDLGDNERIRFMKDGPDVGGFRDEFYKGIMGLLKDLTDG
jgi:hypothetical protein